MKHVSFLKRNDPGLQAVLQDTVLYLAFNETHVGRDLHSITYLKLLKEESVFNL